MMHCQSSENAKLPEFNIEVLLIALEIRNSNLRYFSKVKQFKVLIQVFFNRRSSQFLFQKPFIVWVYFVRFCPRASPAVLET